MAAALAMAMAVTSTPGVIAQQVASLLEQPTKLHLQRRTGALVVSLPTSGFGFGRSSVIKFAAVGRESGCVMLPQLLSDPDLPFSVASIRCVFLDCAMYQLSSFGVDSVVEEL